MTLLQAIWPAPASVKTGLSCRKGGSSVAPYDSFNLGLHVGDRVSDVEKNRSALQAQLGLLKTPQWLEQIHGNRVVEAHSDGRVLTADASYTRSPGVACAVMTADCLPVLFCNEQGTQVAAAHAGWRGLAGGVLEATVASFDEPAEQILAYLGPAIGPGAFEVGIEVLEAFFETAETPEQAEAIAACFKPSMRPLHFFADLYALASQALRAMGLDKIFGGTACTYTDRDDTGYLYFSYRRDTQTGRQASLIWLDEGC